MRFSAIFTAVASFAACASALAAGAVEETTDAANPISAPLKDAVLTAGAAFTVEWLPTAGPTVTLVLRKGKDTKSLDTLEVIAKNLPNNGAFIWVPSKELAGDTDYAIQITSDSPSTSNYSAQFKVISNGKGIKGTTVEPSTTRPVTADATRSSVPTYTGDAAEPATTAVDVYEPSVSGSAAGKTVTGAAWRGVGVAVAVGMVFGGLLVV